MKTIKLINSMDKYVFSSLQSHKYVSFYRKNPEIFREKYKSVAALVVFFI